MERLKDLTVAQVVEKAMTVAWLRTQVDRTAVAEYQIVRSVILFPEHRWKSDKCTSSDFTIAALTCCKYLHFPGCNARADLPCLH